LFLAAVGASQAQNVAMPGQLASNSTIPGVASAFDSTIGTPEIANKADISIVEDKHDQRVRAVWITSILAMTAGTAADAASSWHKRESNSFLASSNGTFGAKGAGIKAGIALGVIAPQIIFRKRRDWHTAFAVGNFVEAGVFTGAAIHNLQVK